MTNKQIEQFGWLVLRFTKNEQSHIASALIDSMSQVTSKIAFQHILDEYEVILEKYNDPSS